MFNKDCDLIFEAYQSDIVEEMPVGLGPAHEEPEEEIAGKFEPGALSKLTDLYLSTAGKKLPPEAKKKILIDQIIAVKQFLKDQEEGSELTGGTLKQFYMGLLKTMVKAGGYSDVISKTTGEPIPYVNLANAKYRARVITKQMALLDVIVVTKGGQVVVKDVDKKEPAIDKVVADTVEGEHQPSPEVDPAPVDKAEASIQHDVIVPHKQYMLSPDKVAGDRINTLDKDVKKAIGAIREGLGIKFTGKELIDVLRKVASGMFGRLLGGGVEKARELGAHMLQIGVLEAEEEEHKGDLEDVRDIDVEDPRYAADDYAEKHFGDLGGGPMDDY